MKMVAIFSFATKAEADAKAADFKVSGVQLDIFEADVDTATCNFSKTGGNQCATSGKVWIVAGTKK